MLADVRAQLALTAAFVVAGCGGPETKPPDVGPPADAGAPPAWDAGVLVDAGEALDADEPSPNDAGPRRDVGPSTRDAGGPVDAGPPPPRTPPPLPTYSGGACPTLAFGASAAAAVNTGFTSAGLERSFRLLVPESYGGSRPYPVVFAWHWLNASSSSFVRDGELESAVEEMGFIAVLPDKQVDGAGNKRFQFDWPFVDTRQAEPELVFFDDLLACVAEQLSIDRARIYGIGVSAGGLWLSHVSTTDRADHFAAVEILSGGLGDVAGVWRMEYQPQANKFPALVLWGGSRDWLGVNFHEASQRYRDALRADGHFVLECVHDAGHAMPPITPPAGRGTRFWSLWRFMLDHPYGVPAGTSPYLSAGLPNGFPSWCAAP